MNTRKLIAYFLTSLVIFFGACGQHRTDSSSANVVTTLTPTNEWFTLAPSIDDFSVEMPGLSSSITSAYPNTYLYRNADGGYVVTSYPLTDEDRKLSEEQKLEASGKAHSQSMLRQFSSDIAPSEGRTITADGFPGREYSFSDGVKLGVLRVILTKKRLYSLWAVANVSNGPSITRFMNSFSLKREKPLQFLEGPHQESGVPYGDPIQKSK